jgi:hypothetical protein
MGRGTRHHADPGITLRVAARWVLLAAVLAGIFGMHVLTAGDDAGGHGALPMVGMLGHHGMITDTPALTSDVAVTISVPAAAALPGAVAAVLRSADGSGGDGVMAGCILFLVVGAAALLLALLISRRATRAAGTAGLGGLTLTDLMRRGPPIRYRPRVALCVIRI